MLTKALASGNCRAVSTSCLARLSCETLSVLRGRNGTARDLPSFQRTSCCVPMTETPLAPRSSFVSFSEQLTSSRLAVGFFIFLCANSHADAEGSGTDDKMSHGVCGGVFDGVCLCSCRSVKH